MDETKSNLAVIMDVAVIDEVPLVLNSGLMTMQPYGD